MDKIVKKEVNFGTLKFTSIKIYKSKNNKLFFLVRIGNNSLFISENLLLKIKKEAS
jgi:hypothetical protein